MEKIKYYGDGDWIVGGVRSSLEEADVVIMPGGGDWNPALYKQEPNSHVRYWSDSTDKNQWAVMEFALKHEKVLWGNCRGIQGITILNGGTLIQHVNHPGSHVVELSNGKFYPMNSCHHQMCNPYNLIEGNDFVILSWTNQLSDIHVGPSDEQLSFPRNAYTEEGVFKEPEFLYFPKTRSLGMQGHVEWMHHDAQCVRIANNALRQVLVNNNIDISTL